MKNFALIVILFFASNSLAAGKNYDCAAEKEKIIKRLEETPTCFKDEDCRYFDYNYPWQPSACMKAIVSTEQEGKTITDLKLIGLYNKNCIIGNKQEEENYTKFDESLKATKCEKPVRLFCLTGKCRTAGYVLHDQPNAIIRVRNKNDDPTSKDIMKMKNITPIEEKK